MRPCVVVPLHDPAWMPNVRANLERQEVEGVRTVIAVNGAASGMTDRRYQTVESGRSHAAACNVGAAWARDRGHTHVVFMDSDDEYGPGYLGKVLAALRTADYCGQSSVRVRLQDGSVHLFARTGRHYMGGTLASSLDAFLDVPETYQDDHDWCRLMESAGRRGVDAGPDEYVYVRHGANAHWRASDVAVRLGLGDCMCTPRPTHDQVLADMAERAGA